MNSFNATILDMVGETSNTSIYFCQKQLLFLTARCASLSGFLQAGTHGGREGKLR